MRQRLKLNQGHHLFWLFRFRIKINTTPQQVFLFLGFLCVNPRAGEWWWQEVLEIISGLSPSGWGKGAARTLFMDIMTKGSLVSPRIKCSNNNVEQYVPISLKFGSKTKPSSCFTLFFSTASLG